MSETRLEAPLFVKWGGSLITDKQRPATARQPVIARLAEELAAIVRAHPHRVVLGHGSGSFGHVAAQRHGIEAGLREKGQLAGVSETQDQAARLHRLVVAALLDAGVPPYSVVAGSAVITTDGVPSSGSWEPVWQALELGLLPVVFGDVILDRARGSAILSTEQIFIELAREAGERRRPPGRVFWLGETDGVWDAEGRPLRQLGRDDLDRLAAWVGGSAGIDVTGGMRHRLEGALALLDLGVESWIVDGREPRVIERIVAGERVGTRVRP